MSASSHSRRAASPGKPTQNFTGDQPDLFQQLTEDRGVPPELDIHYEFLGAVTQAIREARRQGISREKIIDLMNELLPELERPLTPRQLYAWTATSQEYHEFPARYLPAFCAATGCDLPLRVMAQSIGSELIDARDLAAKELGETEIRAAALRRRSRELRKYLSGG